ncbi:MAG: hypothetical protein Q8R13_04055 [bacterium]|nr:hypothetical protein [bacterium]MDZ4296306.1 hypothetical protein [Patescibacteria group bacterium]
MTHYICTGGCGGVSDHPGVCQAQGCPNVGKALGRCDCEDDAPARRGGAEEGAPATDDAPARRSDKTDKVLAGEPRAKRAGKRGAEEAGKAISFSGRGGSRATDEGVITTDDVRKVELRVATVRSAARVEGSEKLLRLVVDLGAEERSILAGIGKAYDPESLAGRQIVIVANLASRSIMGYESQGMCLATGEGEPVLLVPDKTVEAGSAVR